MELKDIATLVGLSITVAGIIWTLSRVITQGATIKDMIELERRLEAKIMNDKKESIESHAGLVSRREFEATVSTMKESMQAVEKRFDKVDNTMDRIETQLDARIQVLDKTIAGLIAILEAQKKRERA